MKVINDYIVKDDSISEGTPWSANRLKNGDASDGLTNWEVNSAEVADGLFKVLPNGNMKQTVLLGGMTPPAIRIKGRHLPEVAEPSYKVQMKVYVELTLNYADGSKKSVVVPVRQTLNAVVGGY